MKRNTKRYLTGAMLAAVAGLILLAVLFRFYIGPKFLQFKRSLSAPPSVLVYSPVQGETAPEGSILNSSMSASGSYPVVRVELWMDGEMLEQQFPGKDTPEGLTTVYANFPLKVSTGSHTLVWRAVDDQNQIGQSSPINISVTARQAEVQLISADEGQNLQEIAENLGGDPDVLVKLNPGLGTGDLPVGTKVKVPAPGGQPPQGGSILVDPPTGGDILVDSPVRLTPLLPGINFQSLISLFATGLPSAPSNLHVDIRDCVVQMWWMDNADNETSFQVWMQAGGGPPSLIATLEDRKGTGTAQYSFTSPAFGIYRFWVEAVNGLGSQPSQVEWLPINDASCGEFLATRLEVEVVDFLASGFQGPVYCYVSLEGNPEKRVPEDGYYNQAANLAAGAHPKSLLLIPMPPDEEVTIEGKCLGHLGASVVELGTFSKSIPRSQWDGSRQEARGGSLTVGITVQPHGLLGAQGSYQYTDYQLPSPHVLSAEPRTDRDPLLRSRLARNITLKWMWFGDQEQINNFVIAMDDVMDFRWANKSERQVQITLPSSCGGNYRFAVAAVGPGGARSSYSAWYYYQQPPCDLYAEVVFDTFTMTFHNDGEIGACDTAELGFDIAVRSANKVWRDWGGGIRWGGEGVSIDCGVPYHLSQFPLNEGSPGAPEVFTVMIEPSTSTLWIYATFEDVDTFIVPWDTDPICIYQKELYLPAAEWAGHDQYFREVCLYTEPGSTALEGRVEINYRVRGYRTPSE